ncbi:MAG: hypothetical protein PHT07_24515 [Paludibacter sp.]|nr:hypothetical protein [Paludibacter sp.]
MAKTNAQRQAEQRMTRRLAIEELSDIKMDISIAKLRIESLILDLKQMKECNDMAGIEFVIRHFQYILDASPFDRPDCSQKLPLLLV